MPCLVAIVDDEAYIPFNKILEKVETPTSQGTSGQQYKLTKDEIQQTVFLDSIID